MQTGKSPMKTKRFLDAAQEWQHVSTLDRIKVYNWVRGLKIEGLILLARAAPPLPKQPGSCIYGFFFTSLSKV